MLNQSTKVVLVHTPITRALCTMNRYILPIFTLLMTFKCYGECVIKESAFTSNSGTEFLFTLHLSQNGTAQLQHEFWAPGKTKEAVIEIHDGKWECEGNNVTVEIDKILYHAQYISIGENPLGMPANTKALSFQPSSQLLGGQLLTEFGI